MSSKDADSVFDNRQAIDNLLGGPWIDDSSLRNTMIVFGSIFSFLLQQLCQVIDFATEETEWDPKLVFPNDRLDPVAAYCRPQFFALLLRSTVAISHEFWDSVGEGQTDIECSDEIWTRVFAWLLVRQEQEESKSEGFVCGVLDILSDGVLATRRELDGIELDFDEECILDELDEISQDANGATDEADIAHELGEMLDDADMASNEANIADEL